MYPGDGQPQQNWGNQQYQGLGYFPQPGSEPPRRRRGMVVVIAIVSLVVIIGAVVTIVLVNRSSDEPAAQNQQNQQTQQTTTPPAGTSKGASELEPRNPGWSVIKNERAALIFEVPPAWTPAPGNTVASKTMPDVVLHFPAALATYQCEGNRFTRGGLGGGTVEKTDLNESATKLAKAFGEEFYSSASPTVQAGEPKQVTAKTTEGKPIKAVQVDAVITTSGNACMADKGKVSVLMLEGPEAYSFLLVNTDVTGGPATPPPPDEAESQKIIDSVRGY